MKNETSRWYREDMRLLIKRFSDLQVLLLGILPIIIVAIIALFLTPEYESILYGFGILPSKSSKPMRIVLATYKWWLAFSLIVIIAWKLLSVNRRRRSTINIGIFTAVAMMGFFIYAISDPLAGYRLVICDPCPNTAFKPDPR